jgi:hypothetical protein
MCNLIRTNIWQQDIAMTLLKMNNGATIAISHDAEKKLGFIAQNYILASIFLALSK